MPRKRSPLEIRMEMILRSLREPFKTEFRFHDTRRWEVDFCYPQFFIAIECEGGTWIRDKDGNLVGGRHQQGNGFVKDVEKYNALTMSGYSLLRFSTSHIKDQGLYVRDTVEKLIKIKKSLTI